MTNEREIYDIEGMPTDTPITDKLIHGVMRQYPGTSTSAQAKYYEEVHQELAPLCRDFERQLAALRAPVEQAPVIERGWLIERKKGGYFYQTPRMNGWTNDSVKALRFARKCDAEAIAGKYNMRFEAIITEHEWHDSAAAPSAPGREDASSAGKGGGE